MFKVVRGVPKQRCQYRVGEEVPCAVGYVQRGTSCTVASVHGEAVTLQSPPPRSDGQTPVKTLIMNLFVEYYLLEHLHYALNCIYFRNVGKGHNI